MKIRPFLAAILAVAVTLLLIGAAGWVVLWRSSPLALQHQPLTLPLAARFIPRQASLSLHLLVPPDQLGAYARAVAPPRQRRHAAAALEQLRDGAFAAAGLDYAEELAGWVGEESSVALLTPAGASQPAGWLLALRSRESEGARRFLQRFWQTRSLAGNELQVSTYRGMGLISGRGALLGQNALPLATALIDDRLVLIASGRGVLEQALDVSQIDELNQAGDPRLATAVATLGQGVALVVARPDSFTPWLAASPFVAAQQEVLGLVAALAPRGRTLDLNGRLELRHAPAALALTPTPDLLAGLQGPSDSLAMIQNPALLSAPAAPGTAASAAAIAVAQPIAEATASSPDSAGSDGDATDSAAAYGVGDTTIPSPEATSSVPADIPDVWSELVAPVLAQALATLPGVLPPLVVAQDPGPLLLSHSSRGWLLATAPDSPAIASISDVLAREGLIAAPLSRNGKTLQLWTQLTAGNSRSHPDQLDAAIAGARLDQRGVAWWSEGITALTGLLEGAAPPSERLAQLQGLEDHAAPLQWAMAAPSARALLARWDPWLLLTGLAGEPLAPTVQGLAVSLESDPAAAAPALRLHGRLELG
ncbi:MAG: hypothetical protein DCF18_06715 [Cyanobium sp.]|uniref:DUF3352 domain-containing protein n=1 Tax=Synechococcus sp. CS-1333 TaxID=2848638 RepID=UPI000DBBB90C|nr:DUF3352 domain-containing protein [Synechococcus sp. CS-1333]MCT0209703.1 DUF3352 domain-containing protein [Synechococcus sp. CS-1333]PZV23387.1 MAG: hypothetical protein DCF18_06715 [Cyanobium sp.]